MSLTAGTGPLGEKPAGRFDFEPPSRVIYWDGAKFRSFEQAGDEEP